ncbi:branched-chain amino acid aminotransferase [Paroceanicella profunda]|uniref:Probable branched-chain-amino-acid aminotransferase n=1 Tax=Paroceanicella profunda TaxID=2579971 RepID=A0A5B8FYM7_9RHOB|nr:branched-chain amino acid aminotransferase [Paroceanicella profunda]QDL91769.1 branched-chain amino acid aminotransferase [Paroceanicella profunda]
MAFGTRIRTYFEGKWHEGNLPIMGAADHGTWQGTLIFDGARAFEGVTPDLGLHCERALRSASVMGLEAPLSAPQIEAIALEGLAAYAPDTPVYIRPMMWSRGALSGMIAPDPATTAFALCLEDLPMADPEADLSLTVSPFLRPHPLAAMTEAKAGGLYANNGRILREAQMRGFHNALSMDFEGNVAETASTNVFAVKDGVVFTPVPNGTFLNGITRQRIIALLRADGVEVHEATMTVAEFETADEIFLTGNANKLLPVTRFEERALGHGPVARRARALYWDYAHATRRAAE